MKKPTQGGLFTKQSYVSGGRLSPASPGASEFILTNSYRIVKFEYMEIDIKNSLSHNRVGSYEQLKGLIKHAYVLPLPLGEALEIYAWNAQVSSAMLLPLHICEVVLRNAVADVLESVYGSRWPWELTFETSLPNPHHSYSMRRDLTSARRHKTTPGQVIPELKFAFWQNIFTSRFDGRLWTPHLASALPNSPAHISVSDRRLALYDNLEKIRRLRNRIAHHEPIFARNLREDLDTIYEITRWRCQTTAVWMDDHQTAGDLIVRRPI